MNRLDVTEKIVATKVSKGLKWSEIVHVYGTTFKELIHEEFGDGIMSAIDFKMDVRRQADPARDRVAISMSGKFLPYKTY